MPKKNWHKVEVTYIIARRIQPGESEPGPGALRQACSGGCGHELWIHPATVEDTGLIPPIFCWQCAREKMNSGGRPMFIMREQP